MKRNTHIETVVIGNEVHFHELPNKPSWIPRIVFQYAPYAKFDKYHNKKKMK